MRASEHPLQENRASHGSEGLGVITEAIGVVNFISI